MVTEIAGVVAANAGTEKILTKMNTVPSATAGNNFLVRLETPLVDFRNSLLSP